MLYDIKRDREGNISFEEHVDKIKDAVCDSEFQPAAHQFQAVVLAKVWANGGLGGQIDAEDLAGIMTFGDQLEDGTWIENSRPKYTAEPLEVYERYGFIHSNHLNQATINHDDDTYGSILNCAIHVFNKLDNLASDINSWMLPEIMMGGDLI